MFFLQNKKPIFFYVIETKPSYESKETKPVAIMFEQTIDNTKEVNQKYVTA